MSSCCCMGLRQDIVLSRKEIKLLCNRHLHKRLIWVFLKRLVLSIRFIWSWHHTSWSPAASEWRRPTREVAHRWRTDWAPTSRCWANKIRWLTERRPMFQTADTFPAASIPWRTYTGRRECQQTTWRSPSPTSSRRAATFRSDRWFRYHMEERTSARTPLWRPCKYRRMISSWLWTSFLWIYHLSVLAIIATFSVGLCSNVAHWAERARFCLSVPSQDDNGATVP